MSTHRRPVLAAAAGSFVAAAGFACACAFACAPAPARAQARPASAAASASASATASPADPGDKHLYTGQVDLDTNLWGIRGAGDGWSLALWPASAASATGSDGAAYAWSGFAGSEADVKAYPSLRIGASNRRNDPDASALPYRFGDNARNVNVSWDFDAAVEGKYNHTLDVFFDATPVARQAGIRGEIMVIVDSSQDARTAGWGRRDAVPFKIGPETWEVWQATQTSNGQHWHVTQFRKRVNAQHFHHDLKDFFAEAAARRPDVFAPDTWVMMVEAGTEIKTGSGRLRVHDFKVEVSPAP